MAALVAEARGERDSLAHRLATATSEIHQLRRRLTRTETAFQEVDELNGQLKQLVEAAEERVKRSERATRDHAARVG